MVNVNRIYDYNDVLGLFMVVRQGLIDAGFGNDPMAAQIAANIKDYVDEDSEVTAFDISGDGTAYAYGFESPCVYISELAVTYSQDVNAGVLNKSYVVELYKPYAEDGALSSWKLFIDNTGAPGASTLSETRWVNWAEASQFKIQYWKNPNAPFGGGAFDPGCDPNCDPNTDPNCDPNCDPNEGTSMVTIPADYTVFAVGSRVELQRPVGGGEYVVVDSVTVPGWFTEAGGDGTLSFQRDITRHRCIKRLWDVAGVEKLKLSLGALNDYNLPGELPVQAHPADAPLTNIGEIGMVFRLPAYYDANTTDPCGVIGYGSGFRTEGAVRVDPNNPVFQPLFNYLTVFDPRVDLVDNDGDGWGSDENGNGIVDANDIDADELKIAGRININTAPWFVISQLPWTTPEIAQAVVAYRDKLRLVPGLVDYSQGRGKGMVDLTGVAPPANVREELGFAGIAELVNVTNDLAEMGAPMGDLYDIRRYGRDKTGPGNPIDEIGFPDLTTDSGTNVDGAANVW
jgi:hypothetical protein